MATPSSTAIAAPERNLIEKSNTRVISEVPTIQVACRSIEITLRHVWDHCMGRITEDNELARNPAVHNGTAIKRPLHSISDHSYDLQKSVLISAVYEQK